MLSDNTYKKYMGRKNEIKALYPNNEVVVHTNEVEPKSPKTGDFIYIPHDCELPDEWNSTIGSIWACHGYREGRMCYDQWILESTGGTKRWVLFKRNIRQ